MWRFYKEFGPIVAHIVRVRPSLMMMMYASCAKWPSFSGLKISPFHSRLLLIALFLSFLFLGWLNFQYNFIIKKNSSCQSVFQLYPHKNHNKNRFEFIKEGEICEFKRSIFQIFWRLHCCVKFLSFELKTSNFGYLLIYLFSLTMQSFRKIGQQLYQTFYNGPPLDVFLFL